MKTGNHDFRGEPECRKCGCYGPTEEDLPCGLEACVERIRELEQQLEIEKINSRHATALAMLAVDPKALKAELAQASENLQRLSGELRNLKELARSVVSDCIAEDKLWAKQPDMILLTNLLEGRCYHPWHVDASGTNLTCPRCKVETR